MAIEVGLQFVDYTELGEMMGNDFDETSVRDLGGVLDRGRVDALKDDISRRGVRRALDVTPADGKMWILDGHHRAAAAYELQRRRVPVRVRPPGWVP